MDDESPDLRALREKLDEEEAAYASLLAALDALATLPPARWRSCPSSPRT